MQDRFKFRVWKGQENRMVYDVTYLNPLILDPAIKEENKHNILMQSTGLKDKNGLNLLFECDIINMEGIKIGNCYENEYLLKDTTNFVIKGMGTKEWRNSEQEAIKRGCYYAE